MESKCKVGGVDASNRPSDKEGGPIHMVDTTKLRASKQTSNLDRPHGGKLSKLDHKDIKTKTKETTLRACMPSSSMQQSIKKVEHIVQQHAFNLFALEDPFITCNV